MDYSVTGDCIVYVQGFCIHFDSAAPLVDIGIRVNK